LTYLLADVVRFTDNRIVKCTLFQMQNVINFTKRENGGHFRGRLLLGGAAEEYAT